jgi:argininosuccinate lyase
MKLWQGRLTGTLHPAAEAFNRSLGFDHRLATVDVRGSIAWAGALQSAGLLTDDEGRQIVSGLERIKAQVSAGTFDFDQGDEDIHSAVERQLTELIGPLAGKLHTGRSRNDQVATDLRLWVMGAIQRIEGYLTELQGALLTRAELDWGTVLPGYTHLQQAQPVLLSHWWLSHFWALQRDRHRLHNLFLETQVCPLGCGALAGTGFEEINRFQLTTALGFREPAPNSLDAVSDRDFAAGLLYACAMIGVHASRLAEALMLYSTREFGYMTLDDAFSTGSSLMPQKKNPDPLELVRGKSGTLTGRLAGFLATLKALPSAYDKDLQEDKLPVFEAADTVEKVLEVLSGVVSSLTVHAGHMRRSIDSQALATDLADALAGTGIPFRQAYALVGKAVRRAEELDLALDALPLAEWQQIQPGFDPRLLDALDLNNSLERRAAWGGTAPQAVKEQLEIAKGVLGVKLY